MCEVQKCCCCVDLRTGAIVMAVLEIIGGLGMFGLGSEWEYILNALVAIGTGVCLLFGAIKYDQTATLVYLILQMISIVLICVISALLFIAANASVSESSGLVPIDAALWPFNAVAFVCCIVASIYIYFWVCAFSFYKGLKAGEITSPANISYQKEKILF